MSRRYGKARVPNCQCEARFTCGPCLAAAPPYHFTPNTPSERLARATADLEAMDEDDSLYTAKRYKAAEQAFRDAEDDILAATLQPRISP